MYGKKIFSSHKLGKNIKEQTIILDVTNHYPALQKKNIKCSCDYLKFKIKVHHNGTKRVFPIVSYHTCHTVIKNLLSHKGCFWPVYKWIWLLNESDESTIQNWNQPFKRTKWLNVSMTYSLYIYHHLLSILDSS